jgi:predicted permease
MSLPGELKRRVQMLVHRNRFRRELDDEMSLHISLREQQQRERGLTFDEAHRAARLRFGNTARIRERSYMAWGWGWLESLRNDVVFGLRAMRRSPGLTLVAVASLALGIGANTAIFSLLDAVLLRSLPVRDPSQLVILGTGWWSGISDGFAVTELYSYPFFKQMRQRNSVFSDTAAIFSMQSTVYGKVQGHANPEPMHVQMVSGNYFGTLGVQPQMGRLLSDADDNSENGNPVAVVSYNWWKRSLAEDPDALDRKLKLGDTTFTIIGVAPPEFFGTKVGEAPDIWVPCSMVSAVPPGFGGYKDNFSESLYVFGRLKPGVNVEQATANVNVLYRQILIGFEGAMSQENAQRLVKAHVPLNSMATGVSRLRREFSQPLRILMAVVALVLLIACANIANLLLARSTARVREFAVRQALGARRMRIVRQLLTESLLLAVAGGALGIGIAFFATRFLLRMVSGGPDTIPLNVAVDGRLLLFTAAVTIATAVLFGILPALRATRLQLTHSLKEGLGSSRAQTRSPIARILVVSQVALSLILMVGAGLFLRTLVNLNHVDTGFNKENVLRLQVDPSSAGYKSHDPRLEALYRDIEARVSTLPGVRAASFSMFTFHEGSWNGTIVIPGMQVNHDLDVKHNVVGTGYFATMQIPLMAGRLFTADDTAASQPVAIISEHMARTLFPGGSPIGRMYHIGGPDNPLNQVIGIVKDVKFGNLTEQTDDIDYLPVAQNPRYLNDFEVRYEGDFGAIASAVQRTIHSLDPALPIAHVTTLDEQVARSVTNERLVAQLSGFFGLLAVFLSCIGIYGLMSYMVTRRTSEIGIRMALGASRSNMRWLVMRESIVLVCAGIVVGVPVTVAGGRLVANMLFGIHATDPLSLAAAVALLLAVTLFAAYLPARRACRVEPMVALRYE